MERLLPKPSTDYDPFSRALMLGARIATGGEVTTQYIRDRFGVSKATAKRDMFWIERVLAPEVAQEANGKRTLKLRNRW